MRSMTSTAPAVENQIAAAGQNFNAKIIQQAEIQKLQSGW
jgi:hypothetical protein